MRYIPIIDVEGMFYYIFYILGKDYEDGFNCKDEEFLFDLDTKAVNIFQREMRKIFEWCGKPNKFLGFTHGTGNYRKTLDITYKSKRPTKPEAIGSHVYADRNGNGNEASKEGYKYRGHGLIQLTGKINFTMFGKSIGKTTDEALLYSTTPEGVVESALWFWKVNNCNKFADSNDIKGQTKVINGGYNGLEERLSLYAKVTKVIKENFR